MVLASFVPDFHGIVATAAADLAIENEAIEENLRQFLLVLSVSLGVATLSRVVSWLRNIPYTLLLLLVGLSTLVMILVWDTGYRLTGIICLCVFYSLAAAFCGVRLKAAVFDESTPFHATLEELANDRERLLP